jgi:hypothetical protein
MHHHLLLPPLPFSGLLSSMMGSRRLRQLPGWLVLLLPPVLHQPLPAASRHLFLQPLHHRDHRPPVALQPPRRVGCGSLRRPLGL